MNILHMIGDFLLSSWIWHVTFDWFHPIVTGLVMFLLFCFIMQRTMFVSFMISVGAQLFAFSVLTMFIIFGFIKSIDWQYEPLRAQEAVKMMTVLMPTLWLSLIYAVLQSLLFLGSRLFWRYNVIMFLVITWLSNGIGAFLSYFLINIIELYYYTG